MSADTQQAEQVPSFCALCVSRCGAIASVEDGRFTALKPDPSHPTGQALCIKGKVAPELVYHPDRLLYPMKRTRPKGDADPGWQRISWDEALDTVAKKLTALSDRHGPETVVFNTASPSTSALSDSMAWVRRLRKAFGSPNQSVSMELCGWGRYLANIYSFGAGLPADCMPDLENAGCILFWGYNPTVSRIAHATATVAAQKSGARLIVIDPRFAGLARRADHWLRVRPGSDGALALGLAHVMIDRGWYDESFVRDWTNGPLLIRSDSGRFLRGQDLDPSGSPDSYLAWDETAGRAVAYTPDLGSYAADNAELALFGSFEVETAQGPVTCRPAFQLTAELCGRYDPQEVERLTGVEVDKVVETANMLWESRPVAYMAWSGLEQQSNATQIARAIGLVYALTGDFDAKGGNVLFPAALSANIQGDEMLSGEQRAKTLGLADRPLGPSRFDHVTSADTYRAILDHQPYAVRGLVSFGSNLLVAHADGERGREALRALEFHVHVDLFMNPSAETADIVLPATSPFESEGLKIGFETSETANSLIQLRKKLVEPRGEARSDVQIVFDLACRLGFGSAFWDGDIDAAYRHQLAPSGVSLESLRENPAGVRVPLQTRHKKYTERTENVARGFATPSRKVEFYSEVFLEQGYPPLPDYEEPLVGPHSRPDLAARYPLILTCAKDSLYCESQHRGLPSLRRRAPDPQVDLHPAAAAARAIEAGDWVLIETPNGRVRARARFDEALDPDVVCGQHGWWQACPEIDAPGFAPFGPDSANFNLVIGHDHIDPVSGSVPLRAYVCEIKRLEAERE
ncbi:molybdopterin-dependent oxidoreductase [Pelagibius sp. Alg239-R121]|uniref:molybdopterin-containing oxidoreductase family protein n=1 Tax=Pelagibius sp. Alg239-R121 TaxID=2993448 RepID=UPI0024A696E6|nr:molybdopterin-dependent oxidoreductase [Pelagibius sp. Alg239-R121]